MRQLEVASGREFHPVAPLTRCFNSLSSAGDKTELGDSLTPDGTGEPRSLCTEGIGRNFQSCQQDYAWDAKLGVLLSPIRRTQNNPPIILSLTVEGGWRDDESGAPCVVNYEMHPLYSKSRSASVRNLRHLFTTKILGPSLRHAPPIGPKTGAHEP